MSCLFLAAGCSIPIPQATGDPTRYYVLSASGAPAAPADAGPAIRLRPVEVAKYLDVRPMIIRRGGNEIEFREFARWGEPLGVGIGRVLREELIGLGVGRVVAGSDFRAGASKDVPEISVRVLACEGTSEGVVIFRAAWSVTAPGAPVPAGSAGEYVASDARWDGTGEASLAEAMSRAVSGLAAEIARALKR